MHVLTYVRARAPPLAAAAAGRRRCRVRVRVRVRGSWLVVRGPWPGFPTWFFLNQGQLVRERFRISNGCPSARTDPSVRQPLSENRQGG